MLLDFPPELTQLILLNCTTPAFLQAAFTCRILYEIASSSREVLAHHLRRTPGPSLDTSSLRTSHLFPLLKCRATKQLYGSQFDASCITFKFGDQAPSLKASSVVSHNDKTLILTAYCKQGIIPILQVREGQVLSFSRAKLPWFQPGSVEILKTAFGGSDLIYVLHRFTPHIEEHDFDEDHPFVKQAREPGRGGLVYLSCHSLRFPDDPVRVTTFPEHVDFEPSALAVSINGGTFAISWCHRMLSEHTVILYTISNEQESNIAPSVVGKCKLGLVSVHRNCNEW